MSTVDKKYLYILFLLLSGYYLLVFPHQLSASDTIFYLMSSRELSAGMIWEGINSYWGILISVMMVPLMWVGIKGLWAFKVIQIIIGLWGVHLSWQLGQRFRLSERMEFWAMLTVVFLLWMMSMSHTPDLLMAVLLMAYFLEIIKAENRSGWKIGIIGGLLFLCKGYGFPFFIAHFTLWHFYKKLTGDKSQAHVQRNYFLTGMLAFMIIAGSWIAILSFKYGHFTIGSSGSYNMAYMGPKMQFNPPYFDRLQNPETAFTTYFIGEEQGLFADYGKWNPLGSKDNFRYLLKRIPANMSKLYYITFLRDLVVLLLLGLILCWLFGLRLEKDDKTLAITLLIFLGIYNAGYFILFPNERYLWINHIVLTLIFFRMLGGLLKARKTMATANIILACTIVIITINIHDRVTFRTQENAFHTPLHTAQSAISALALEGKNVVSNIKPAPSQIPDYMDPTCLLMYEQRFKLWGFTRTHKLNPAMVAEMTAAGIDYFLLWGQQTNTAAFSGYAQVYANVDIGLRIFSLQGSE